MTPLTPYGQQRLAEIAQRNGVSYDGAYSMLQAVWQGQGQMAQFNHPDFGGMGQWMRGGMTMVSDLFNNALKARVDGVCYDLANLLGSGSDVFEPLPPAPAGGFSGGMGGGQWWPQDLGWPSTSGAQNNQRYAWFPGPRRLAIDDGGVVTVYDTLDHQIGGVQQQQSGSGGVGFTSQYGWVDVARLPVVWSSNGLPPVAPPPAVAPAPAPWQAAPAFAPEPLPAQAPPLNSGLPSAPPGSPAADILGTLERLASLHAQGVLTTEEFAAKKAELLNRL